MARSKDKQKEERDKYQTWKQNIPIIYDWILNHHLTWPSQSCRWGLQVEDFKYKRRQKVYLSDRTDGSEPNKLSVWTVDVVKPRVAGAEVLKYDDKAKSPFIKPYTTILHPGEVNKIREVPMHPHIVVTHTDDKELYVWDVEKQPNRAHDKTSWGIITQGDDKKRISVADLVLEGHAETAQFALGCSSAKPLVASGGEDQRVLVWNLEDHDGGGWLRDAQPAGEDAYKAKAPRLGARLELTGHTATIEDVVWRPGSGSELASVGDDWQLLLWDTNNPGAPAARVKNAHGEADLHCVDWSPLQPELLVTGAADGTVKVWDRRALGGALHTFQLQEKPIMRVEWAPYRKGVFASGGEDDLIAVWDMERKDAPQAAAQAAFSEDGAASKKDKEEPDAKKPRLGALPPQLMYQHAGHRSQVVDFQWHPSDPFTMVSVSDGGDGGTLQVWRMSDLIWRPIDDVLAELESHKEYILTGKDAPAAARDAGPKEAAGTPVPKLAPLKEEAPMSEETVAAPPAPEGASEEEAAATLANAPPVQEGLQKLDGASAPDQAADGGSSFVELMETS